MPTGNCALCFKFSALRESHIIPNAYFRQMKRQNSGQLISFDPSRDERARRSMESFPEHMLCDLCEKKFSYWETPCIDSLRRSSRHAEKRISDGGFNLHRYDYERLRLFLLSIFWRAATSKLRPFANVTLEKSLLEELRYSLSESVLPDTLRFTSRLRRLVYRNSRLSMDQMESILVTPPAPQVLGKTFIYTFVFGGYVVDYFVPHAPYKYRNQPGVVKNHSSQFVPMVSLQSVPHLVHLLAAAIDRERP